MTTYFMMGKYSANSIKEATIDRTEKAGQLIHELGGTVKAMYALLGGYDIVLIVELADEQTAMKVSLGLSALTGISFSTFPALSIADFDKIVDES